jgi:TolB-like protein
MKKVIFSVIFILFTVTLFPQQFTLNDATKTASQEINSKIPIGNLLAVISIKSLSDDLTLHIISLLETGLVNSEKLEIVSRKRIQSVMDEQNFGMSGYVDDNSAQRIGKILGAKYVLTGDMIKPENEYYLHIQVLETETARIMYSRNFEIKNSELRNYEQLIILRQRQEQREREQLIKDEERRQKEEINRIKAQKRKQNWDNFLIFITPNFHFGNWTPVSLIYFEIEYNYEPNMPLGFSIGIGGLYTSWNFYLPDLAGYEESSWLDYDGDGKATWSPEDYHDRGDKTYEGFEWIVGYKLNLLTGFLMLPIGFGAQHANELRLFDHIYSSSPDKIRGTEWLGQATWTTSFVAEIGLEIVLGNYVAIGGTYRLKNFNDSSFTISAGVIFLSK